MFGRVLGRRLGTALAIAAVILYTILVGADAAVVRAAVMGVMAIALRQVGLPSEELREVLESYPVLRTDRDGWVEIATDGEEVWIATGGN